MCVCVCVKDSPVVCVSPVVWHLAVVVHMSISNIQYMLIHCMFYNTNLKFS